MSKAADHSIGERLGIYGMVAFGSANAEQPKRRQIGTAVRNEQGVLELTFAVWPTNLNSIEIGPID